MAIDATAAAVFESAMKAALSMPGVKVDRDQFLKSELRWRCGRETTQTAIATTPLDAGVSARDLNDIADRILARETLRTTAISAAVGMPGGAALFATVPADTAQYLVHVLRVAQQLAYLYGWEDLSRAGDDPQARSALMLFIGVMFGVGGATMVVSEISKNASVKVATRVTAKALASETVFPMLQRIAAIVGRQLSAETAGKAVGKAVPIIGGIISGSVTYSTFAPMARRLKTSLAELAGATVDSDGRPREEIPLTDYEVYESEA